MKSTSVPAVHTVPPKPGEYRLVKLSAIQRSATNPRKTFDPGPLAELAEDLKSKGILQPLLVRPLKRSNGVSGSRSTDTPTHPLSDTFELVAGERRHRAAELAKLTEVPVIVRELSDKEAVEIQLIENLQRVDLSALEEAESFGKLIATGEYTAQTLADKLSKSRSHIYGRLKLIRLQPALRAAVLEGKLDISAAGHIASIPGPKEQAECLKIALKPSIYGEPLSVREIKRCVEQDYRKSLKDAPFDPEANLADKCTCTVCPRRSGNMADEFPELAASPNVCTDTVCYRAKVNAHNSAAIAEAHRKNVKVLSKEEWSRSCYGGDYIKLNETNHYDPKRRTYRENLKAAYKGRTDPDGSPMTIAAAIAVDEDGTLHELCRRDQLKIAGVPTEYGRSSRSSAGSAAAAAERKKAILENKITQAVCTAVVTACEETKPTLKLWQLLSQAAAESCWHDAMVDIGKRRHPEAKNGTAGAELVRKEAKDLTEPQCRGFVMEILCLHGMRQTWCTDTGAKQVAALYGVDEKKIAARVKKELAAKAKGKKK